MGGCSSERAWRGCAGQMSDSLMCCWVIASFLEARTDSNFPTAECRSSLRRGIQEGEVERKLKCGWDSLQKKLPKECRGLGPESSIAFCEGVQDPRHSLGGLSFQRRQVLEKSSTVTWGKVKIFLIFHFYSNFVSVEGPGWDWAGDGAGHRRPAKLIQIYWAEAAVMSHVLKEYYLIWFDFFFVHQNWLGFCWRVFGLWEMTVSAAANILFSFLACSHH